MRNEVAVVILAGGEGSRIGGRKPSRMLAGERLIDRAMRLAGQWSNLIAISIRDPRQVEPIDALLLVDPVDVQGPLGGLISALRFAEANNREFVLTIPADMPFLPPTLLARLISRISAANSALASSGGHLQPVCGLWRASAVRDATRYVESGRRSLKGFAELIGFETVDWSTEFVDPFFNINSACDLIRAEQLI